MFFKFRDIEETIINIKEIEYIRNEVYLSLDIYFKSGNYLEIIYNKENKLREDLTHITKRT